VSQVARITGVSHWRLASGAFLKPLLVRTPGHIPNQCFKKSELERMHLHAAFENPRCCTNTFMAVSAPEASSSEAMLSEKSALR
jgi:hypothetical protein